jgi:hypothetical protein
LRIEPTKYYDEYLRYFELATLQQEHCNLGIVDHKEFLIGDTLMEQVSLYDVVERKYAGFSHMINDIFYGWTDEHPYWKKMEAGLASSQRINVAKSWTGKKHDLPTMLYLMILHRVTGSGINYGLKVSGYHNSIIPDLAEWDTVDEFIKLVNLKTEPFYTSVGYQFPAFPKPPPHSRYRKGGDYYLSKYAPRLAQDLAEFLSVGGKKDLREIGGFMLNWNVENGLRQYHFQYAAVVADVADWYPQFVNRESMFYYGTNAKECISYLAKPTVKMKKDDFLDEVMEMIYEDTKSYPYNAEDICCDYIRWVENYIKPGADYHHINMDATWNSCKIKDHPYGRQKAMLEHGLVETFNGRPHHPSDDTILKEAGINVEKYKDMVCTND